MDSMQTDEVVKSTESFIWDDSSTQLLLNFYREAVDNFGKTSHLRKKNQLWIQIVEELNKYGYNLTPKQAQNRLVTLERSFKKRNIDGNRKNLNLTSAHFDEEVKEIMEMKHSYFKMDCAILDENTTASNDDPEVDGLDNKIDFSTSSLCLTQSYIDPNRWDPESTKVFINVFLTTVNNPAKMRMFKTKKKLWQYIAEKINAQGGYDFTGRQTRNRLSTLIRAYKRFMARKRCGIRAFFMFEPQVRKILEHKIVLPAPGDADSDAYDDEDDDDMEEVDLFKNIDIKEIDVGSIDNIDTTTEVDPLHLALPRTPSQAKIASSISSASPISPTEGLAILNELKLLRKGTDNFHQQMFKIEEEKVDLMRQNNILLKVLIERLSNKS